MGNLYVLQGNVDQAEKEFREVLRLNGADSDGNYNLGLVLLGKKRPVEEAILYFERVHPATIASRINLAKAYFEAGRTAEGLRTATELSAQNKDNVQVHFTLGVLLVTEKEDRVAQGVGTGQRAATADLRHSSQSRRSLFAKRRACKS